MQKVDNVPTYSDATVILAAWDNNAIVQDPQCLKQAGLPSVWQGKFSELRKLLCEWQVTLWKKREMEIIAAAFPGDPKTADEAVILDMYTDHNLVTWVGRHFRHKLFGRLC